MKGILHKSLLCAGSFALVLSVETTAKAAVLYEAGGGSPSALQAYKGPASGNGIYGYGDDYNTGASGTVLISGLSFEGGFTGAGAYDELNIDFYNTSGGFVTSLTVPASQIPNTYTYLGNSLPVSDFGSGLSIPGSGYVFFAPANTQGTQSAQFTLGYGGAAPTVGTSDSSPYTISDSGVISATTESGLAFTPGVGLSSAPAPYADVAISVPEPASLGLVATGGLLLLRRRRTA